MIAELKATFRTLAQMKTPKGYALREPGAGEQIRCTQPGLQTRTGQVLEGHDRVLLVGDTVSGETRLVLGWLDEVILLPALIWLAVRLLPEHVRTHGRQQADAWLQRREQRPRSRTGAVVIVGLWVLALGGLAWWWLG